MLDIISMTELFLKHAANRNKVISDNVARSGIPGAKAYDLESFDKFLSRADRTPFSMILTQSSHISGRRKGGGSKKILVDTSEIQPNGSNIVVEDEVHKLKNNQNKFNSATRMYNKTHELMSSALGRTGG